jgi:hypothetical protein
MRSIPLSVYNLIESGNGAATEEKTMKKFYANNEFLITMIAFGIIISSAMGAWVGYVSHCQHMSLVKSINSTR